MKVAVLAIVLCLSTAASAQQAIRLTAPSNGDERVALTLAKHPTDPLLTRIAVTSSGGKTSTFDAPDVTMKYSPDGLVFDLKNVTLTVDGSAPSPAIKSVRLTYRDGKFVSLSSDGR